MSNARDAILESIRRGRGAAQPVPAYAFPAPAGDLASHFIAKARACIADVHEIASEAEVPATVRAISDAACIAPSIHIPSHSELLSFPWQRDGALTVTNAPPSGVDTAIARADYGIAETGTLAFLSGANHPSSWHFRPGREIVLLERARILPRLEDLFTEIRPTFPMPATLNLITGPSRTADIEQTIELGAHGPCAIHVILIGR